MALVRVGKPGDVPEGEVRVFQAGGKSLALANVEGRIYAIDNVCTHDGGPLGEGYLWGDQVECPRHGARFDVKTGAVHLLFCHEYMRCFYRKSDDGGRTFSPPVEITSTFEPFRRHYDFKVLATGPGHGIQLATGRLVVPVWLSTGTGGHAHRPSVVATITSDDHGATWQCGQIVAGETDPLVNPSEAQAVELTDGRNRLAPYFDFRILRRRCQQREGTLVTDLTERRHRVLSDVRVRILRRAAKRLDGIRALEVAERLGRTLPGLDIRVAKRGDQHGNRGGGLELAERPNDLASHLGVRIAHGTTEVRCWRGLYTNAR